MKCNPSISEILRWAEWIIVPLIWCPYIGKLRISSRVDNYSRRNFIIWSDFKNMAETQLVLMQEMLTRYHPGSYVGVTSFRDKPIGVLASLIRITVSSLICRSRAISPKSWKVDRTLTSTGGGYLPENQFGAMIATLQSQTPNWHSVPDATRLIVVSTDAGPHFQAMVSIIMDLLRSAACSINRGWMSNALGNTIQRCVIWTLLLDCLYFSLKWLRKTSYQLQPMRDS